MCGPRGRNAIRPVESAAIISKCSNRVDLLFHAIGHRLCHLPAQHQLRLRGKMPFCVLGPEMALGDPPSPAPRDLTGTTCNSPEMGSLQRWKRTMLPKLSGVKQRGLGSVFSGLSYNSFKSSMKRGASVKVTRRERKIVRAQDIFADEPIL